MTFEILTIISSKNCLLETINLRSRGGNKLDDFAENTLGNEFKKTGHGSDAPKLYKDGKYDELLSYNKQDVFITKLLYEHIKNKGYLVNGFGTTLTFDFKRR